jgi:3-methyladenine DNA glycosylase AlkD
MTTNVKATLKQLEALGNESVRARYRKQGGGESSFGVPLGEIRKVAAKIKSDHELATALWATGNLDARLLAILLIQSKKLSATELDRMVRSATVAQLADWLNAYVVKVHPDKEALRQKWMEDDDPWAARAGWTLTSERVGKNPDGLDVPGLLDRIESEMGGAAPETQ